ESGEEMRIEHWTNAAEQGAAAAANLLSELAGVDPIPYAPVPFFWSDQFDSRIQFVGRAHGDDEIRVVAGHLDGKFTALYGRGRGGRWACGAPERGRRRHRRRRPRSQQRGDAQR